MSDSISLRLYLLQKNSFCNWKRVSVGIFRVKYLVCPEKDDHFVVAYILDIMRVSWRNVHDLDIFSRHMILDHFAAKNLAEPNDSLALDYTELLDLAVMVMVTSRDAPKGL